MASLRNELAFALRSLKRSPGFVILVVMSLGIALGVTTTMFGLVDTALNPAVPMREAGHLVVVSNDGDGKAHDADAGSVFDVARASGNIFAGTGAVASRFLFLRIGNYTDERSVSEVSPEFFQVTGVQPFLGQALNASGAMVSFDLWRKALGSRRDLRGTTVIIEDRTYEIVGVLPPYMPDRLGAAVFLPMAAEPAGGGLRFTRAALIARLSPETTWEQAQSTLRSTGDPVLTVRFGTGRKPFRFVVRPLLNELPDAMSDLQKILLAGGVLVLLIACGNMANLVLARGLAREREFAVRFSLGAPRMSVVRQVVMEALLCALGGALVGIVAAKAAFSLITWNVSRDVPGLGAMVVTLSWRIFGFTLGIATLTTLVFTIVPAFRTSRVDLNATLKASAGTTTGRTRSRFSALLVGEVALSMALMLGASLLLRAVGEMRATEFGYNPRGLLDVGMYLRRRPDGTVVRSDSLIAGMRERVLRVPGVLGASAYGTVEPPGGGVTSILAGGGTRWQFEPRYTAVDPGFFRTMGVALSDGRDFVDGDAGGRGAVILNVAAARLLFLGERAVGQMLKLGEHASHAPIVPVVGIARDMFEASTVMPVESAEPEMWVVPPPGVATLSRLRVRVSEANRAGIEATVETRLRTGLPLEATLAVSRPLEGFDAAVLAREFIGRLFVLFALIGCGLAAVGVYCLLAFVVAQRRREFAVRIALGATRQDVMRLVLRDGAVMVLAGTAIGAFVAMWLAKALDAMLYSVFYTDARSLVVAEGLLIATALIACLVPARRAARSEPVEMLRAS